MAFLIAARRRTAAAFFAALLVLSSAAAAQRPQGEDALKAAYLYNFTKFIEWPASAFSGTTAPFTVCVLADDRFRREVEGILRGEKVGERPIEVTPSAPDDLKLCHLVYFSRTEAER